MISYTLSKQEFLQFQSAFKARAKTGSNSSADMVLYNIVRGKSAKHGFTPITNQIKINNGASEWSGFNQAKLYASFRLNGPKKKETFKSLYTIELTEEQFAAFSTILKAA